MRYNAEKKKIANYYSTPIYSFRCKCHLCSGWFEIQTDPKVCGTPLLIISNVLTRHSYAEHEVRRYFWRETKGRGLEP